MAKTDFILGTAGHIDHGKSSLVRALTGTDPDRLSEEKERGITITLGFAQLVLPSGRHLGVVDVPGHERFVRQMVAGASGMDLALLVIAADDGVMPQTVEHMAVLELLGVRSCVVALTKADMVDEDWLLFMEDEVAGALEDTPFEGAPIVPCSSVTGQGLDELKAALDEAARHAERTKPAGGLRYPVDRVFTVKGFGTVATGTLWSGSVRVGDELEVLPRGLRTKVRSIQVHGKDRDAAQAGNRVALCLSGLSTDDVRPGDFIAAPGSLQVTDRFDAQLTYKDPFSSGRPLESGSRAHIAHGTREVVGRVLCMDGKLRLEPGETAQVQIRLDEPLPLSYGDRFIARSFSPVHVIAGGSVLSAHPRRRTTLSAVESATLSALAAGDAVAAVDACALGAGEPFTVEQAASDLGLPAAQVGRRLGELQTSKRLLAMGTAGRYLASTELHAKLVSKVESCLMRFHNANPDATGLAKEELRHQLGLRLDPACFDALLEEAEARGVCVQVDGELSHPKAGAGARAQVLKAAQLIGAALDDAAGMPPALDVLLKGTGLNPGIARKGLLELIEQGRAVRITNELVFSAAVIDDWKKRIAAFIDEHGPATAAQLKDACGTSRKYMMPVLEWLDAQAFTKRVGDLRTLA
ncbi:MAG: selenocysteine-specific translation elongation factor [Coriobacteriales bacterium]